MRPIPHPSRPAAAPIPASRASGGPEWRVRGLCLLTALMVSSCGGDTLALLGQAPVLQLAPAVLQWLSPVPAA